jgi:hypothetical protein
MAFTIEEFRLLFRSFQKSAFRLQLLPAYRVMAEQEEFARYLDGEPLPERPGVPWLETMTGQVRKGRTWTNVHLLPKTLTPYLRYLTDWWYVYQARAGAEIRFLPSQYTNEMQSLAPQDFWLFDDRLLILLQYGEHGEFLGVDEASSPDTLRLAQKARDFALEHSEDLRAVLARRRAGTII